MNRPEFESIRFTGPVVHPEDFFGIEDVVVSDEKDEVIDGGFVELTDIQEVTDLSQKHIVDGGTVSMRKHVTTTILSLWVVWTLVGLIVFIETGNTILLLSSPAIMSVPLYRVLGYYF